jgi:hypothetical protein
MSGSSLHNIAALLLSTAVGAQAQAPASVVIEARVGEGPWTQSAAVSPRVGQKVSLRVAPVPGAVVHWYQLVPDTARMYKNAQFPWDPEPYRWNGIAPIGVVRVPLMRFDGRWEVELFPQGRRGNAREWAQDPRAAGEDSEYFHADVGSFWFQAELAGEGWMARSPGTGPKGEVELSTAVLRVSLRDGDGFLGMLSSFHNVPAVFGSMPRQSMNYMGVDCADVLVAAHARWLGRDEPRNYNVAALVAGLPHAAEFDVDAGTPSRRVAWGGDIRPGDLIAVRYRGARAYQHIGALYADDGDGRLGPGDLVMHAGPWPLAVSRLEGGAFDGHAAVLRFAPDMVERPISFSESRSSATRAYAKLHYGSEAVDIEPTMIVLHWTGIASLEASWKTFDRETLPAERGDISAGGAVNVSAHYLVARDGTILRLMPETRMARHAIGLNHAAIGIENVGGAGDRGDLTPAQVRADAWLVRRLKERHPGLRRLIGHYETERFRGQAPWKELVPGYKTVKQDPGERFMAAVRVAVADLGLEGAP